MSKKGIIVQARVGSTRLPGKILLPFVKNDSIIDIVLDKLEKYRDSYEIILATGHEQKNLALKDYANNHNVHFFVGDENNVLKRFVTASEKYGLDSITRVCSDNPFLETDYLDRLMDIYSTNPDYDYLSYRTSENIPVIKSHLGIFAEMVKVNALKRALSLTNDPFYLEHVTNYIYENSDVFNVKLIDAPELVYDRKDLRLTVDNSSDFKNLSVLFEESKKRNLDFPGVLRLIDENEILKKEMLTNINKYNK